MWRPILSAIVLRVVDVLLVHCLNRPWMRLKQFWKG